MKLSQSLEDYLETVLLLSEKGKVARVKEIAQQRNVKPSSVIDALKTLSEKGLIEHERYGYVRLTRAGKRVAKKIYRRHKILKQFFKDILGLNEESAQENACIIEHYINKQGMERLLAFLEFIQKSETLKNEFINEFHKTFSERKRK